MLRLCFKNPYFQNLEQVILLYILGDTLQYKAYLVPYQVVITSCNTDGGTEKLWASPLSPHFSLNYLSLSSKLIFISTSVPSMMAARSEGLRKEIE